MVDVPERNFSRPRKALSFLFPSGRPWNGNNDQKKTHKIERNSSFGYFSTTPKSQDSSNNIIKDTHELLEGTVLSGRITRKDTVSSSESSINKFGPSRMTFRVMNPDETLSSTSATTSKSSSSNRNKGIGSDDDDDDDDDDDEHEVIHYQTHQDENQQQQKDKGKATSVFSNDVSTTIARGDSVSQESPVFIASSSPPPPPPEHALFNVPSTPSSLTSPDAASNTPAVSALTAIAATERNNNNNYWYAQGWKISSQSNSDKKNRQSKIMEVDEETDNTLTNTRPRAIKTSIVLTTGGDNNNNSTNSPSSALSSSSSPPLSGHLALTTPSLSSSTIPYHHRQRSRSSLDTFRQQPSSSDVSPFPSPIVGNDNDLTDSTKIETPSSAPVDTSAKPARAFNRYYNVSRTTATTRPRPTSPSPLMPMMTSSSNNSGPAINRRSPQPMVMGYHHPLSSSTTNMLPAQQATVMTPTYAQGLFIQNNYYNTRNSIPTTKARQKNKATATQFSKYAKASYSLTNHPDAIKMYRSMAESVGDPNVQLSYAKYLLEIAELYGGGGGGRTGSDGNNSNGVSSPPTRFSNEGMISSTSVASFSSAGSDAGRALSMDGGHRSGGGTSSRVSLDSIRSTPGTASSSKAAMARLGESERRKKKMLEDEGIRWIKLLAKQNVGEAAYIQASWIEKGKYGFSKNKSKAFKLYKIAANEGIPEAMHAIAITYEKSGDIRNAVLNYRDAASKGVVEAIYRMAKIHLHGEFGQRQNMSTGLELLSQAADGANELCPDPPYLFGLILTNTYPKADIPMEVIHRYGGELAALRFFEHAAQLGYIHAECRIAFIYEYGLYGAPIHFAKSFGYYDSAARRNNHPQAMLGLSRLYNRGCRGPNDMLTEEERLARDVSGWLAATVRNEDAAFSWCQKAADRGLDEAMFLLGWYYETGVGVPRDFAKAQEYYRKAGAKGHKAAAERQYKTNSVTRQQHEDTRRSIRPQGNPSCIIM